MTTVVARVPMSLLDRSNAAFHLPQRSEVRAGNDITSIPVTKSENKMAASTKAILVLLLLLLAHT